MKLSYKHIIPYSLLFIFTFVYFAFPANYILFYQEKSSIFLFTENFISEHLRQPGSIVIYLGKLVTAFYYNPIIGALFISALTSFCVLVISETSKKISGVQGVFTAFLTGSLLILLQSDQDYMIYNSIGILMQILVFYVYIYFRSDVLSWIVAILIPVWYFITGSFSFIFLLMLTVTYLQQYKKSGWIRLSVAWSLLIFMIFISGKFLFFQPLRNLILFPFSGSGIGSSPVFFGLIVLVLVTLPLNARLSLSLKKIKIPALLHVFILPILMLSVSGFLALKKIKPEVSEYYYIEKLFYEQKIDEVIRITSGRDDNNRLTSYLANIAMCERRKLADRLFSVPQSLINNTLFLEWERIGEILKRGGHFYYTIGMINEAHRWAYESMVMQGYTPEVLKMLIKTELINGNHKMASRYISLLKSTLFYRKEALRLEKFLFNEEMINSDPELGIKRKIRTKEDFFVIPQNPLVNLDNALVSDSLNPMTFQYKLAYLFLKKDFMSIVNEIPNLKRYGFETVPVNMQEAALVYMALPGNESADFGEYKINDETRARFKRFYQIFQRYGNDRKMAEPALKEYKDTFWYYVLYY